MKVNDNDDEVEWNQVMIMIAEALEGYDVPQQFYDELTGLELNADDVVNARAEEMDFVKKLGFILRRVSASAGKRPAKDSLARGG